MLNLAQRSPFEGSGFLWDPSALDQQYGREGADEVDHFAMANHDPEFRAMMKTIRTSRREWMTRFKEGQLELDFTPRRTRWARLGDTPEDTRMWPEWLLLKLHHVLLDDVAAYLHMAFVAPQVTSSKGVMDRLVWVRDQVNEAFSFNDCCRISGIDPEPVRNTILRKFRNLAITEVEA